MKNRDQNHEEFIPGNEDKHASHHPNPDREIKENWDEDGHIKADIRSQVPKNERRNLNPDREKRTGSNLNPDRNSGDR